MSFEWLNDVIQGILKFIPRPVIVRATHAGIKWVHGKHVRKMNPGIHVVWPLVTDWEVVVAARQTNNLPNQALITRDNKQIVVGGIIIYSIEDVELAIGQLNWDYAQTVNDIAQAVIVSSIVKWNFTDLLDNLDGELEQQITLNCQEQLREFGIKVERVSLTDFSTCRVFKLMSSTEGINKTTTTF